METAEELADRHHADIRDFFLQIVRNSADLRRFFFELLEEIGQFVHDFRNIRADFHEAARENIEIVVLIEFEIEKSFQQFRRGLRLAEFIGFALFARHDIAADFAEFVFFFKIANDL